MAIARHLCALVLLVLFVSATSAWAQVFPTPSGTAVIDDAALIPPEDETALVARLDALRAEGAGQIMVVTLVSTALYAGGEDVPSYARLLFEHFELGAVEGGKGMLLLVFLEDRELRIETGSAFAGAEDMAAIEAIIAQTLTPALAEERAAEGIAATVEALATQVMAEPVAAPVEAPAAEGGGGNALWVVLGVVVAAVGGLVALFRRNAAKLAAQPCPACGKPGLKRETVTLQEATEKAEGRGERRTTCPHCGHAEAVPFTIARKERQGGTGAKQTPTGPDKQQGGGASGTW